MKRYRDDNFFDFLMTMSFIVIGICGLFQVFKSQSILTFWTILAIIAFVLFLIHSLFSKKKGDRSQNHNPKKEIEKKENSKQSNQIGGQVGMGFQTVFAFGVAIFFVFCGFRAFSEMFKFIQNHSDIIWWRHALAVATFLLLSGLFFFLAYRLFKGIFIGYDE